MAIVVSERWCGRKLTRGESRAATVEYIVTGTDSEQAACDAVTTYLTDNNLTTWDTSIPYQNMSAEQWADQIWLVTVNYGFSQSGNTNQTEYSFDTGGGSMKVTQTPSSLTINKYAKSGTTAPDFKGAIGVDDNSVNGCDIVVPAYSFSMTKSMAASAVNNTYKAYLFNLTGKVNHATWNGYNQGEALFLGASGSKHGRSGNWEIAYKFSCNPNKTNIQIGDITGIAKKGWEYLWVRYEKGVDQNVLVQTPAAVYVHQVYEYGDFTLLGV